MGEKLQLLLQCVTIFSVSPSTRTQALASSFLYMTCFRLQLASAEHGAREEQHKQCLETSQELRYVRECERSTSKQYQVSGAGGTRMTAVVVSVDCLSILGGVKIITDACRSWQRNKSLGIAYLCSMSRLRLFVRRNAVSSARVDFTGFMRLTLPMFVTLPVQKLLMKIVKPS